MSNLIECPHCGAQYLPEEIFIPNEFFKSKSVDLKKRSIIDGKFPDEFKFSLNNIETYECDFCETEFTIEASVKFKCNAHTSIDEEDSITTIEIEIPDRPNLPEIHFDED